MRLAEAQLLRWLKANNCFHFHVWKSKKEGLFSILGLMLGSPYDLILPRFSLPLSDRFTRQFIGQLIEQSLLTVFYVTIVKILDYCWNFPLISVGCMFTARLICFQDRLHFRKIQSRWDPLKAISLTKYQDPTDWDCLCFNAVTARGWYNSPYNYETCALLCEYQTLMSISVGDESLWRYVGTKYVIHSAVLNTSD